MHSSQWGGLETLQPVFWVFASLDLEERGQLSLEGGDQNPVARGGDTIASVEDRSYCTQPVL